MNSEVQTAVRNAYLRAAIRRNPNKERSFLRGGYSQTSTVFMSHFNGSVAEQSASPKGGLQSCSQVPTACYGGTTEDIEESGRGGCRLSSSRALTLSSQEALLLMSHSSWPAIPPRIGPWSTCCSVLASGSHANSLQYKTKKNKTKKRNLSPADFDSFVVQPNVGVSTFAVQP
ncbi:hypothetical protein MTO96_002063 [Rhipicephalus appendiculatus]